MTDKHFTNAQMDALLAKMEAPPPPGEPWSKMMLDAAKAIRQLRRSKEIQMEMFLLCTDDYGRRLEDLHSQLAHVRAGTWP